MYAYVIYVWWAAKGHVLLLYVFVVLHSEALVNKMKHKRNNDHNWIITAVQKSMINQLKSIGMFLQQLCVVECRVKVKIWT